MLNAIWVGFFLVAFVTALVKLIFLGQTGVFVHMMQATFDTSKTAFQIALGLTGVMALWLGIMRIGERAGFLRLLTRALTPLFARLFPEVPRDHPALGAMVMNVAANMMGLDNAATPLGLKAMRELQTLNPSTDTASNAQILFLVLNSASVTLLPVTIFTYRAQLGAVDPTDVFIPILIATYASAMTGLVAVAVFWSMLSPQIGYHDDEPGPCATMVLGLAGSNWNLNTSTVVSHAMATSCECTQKFCVE